MLPENMSYVSGAVSYTAELSVLPCTKVMHCQQAEVYASVYVYACAQECHTSR